jgi:hypothetical protein
MFCHRCGTKNPDNAFFCNRCGTALIRSPPQQITPQQIKPQQVQPQQVQPQQVQPQQVQPQQVTAQQVTAQQVTAQQVTAQKSSRPRDVAIGAPSSAVYGHPQGGAHPFLLLFEVIFSVAFAVLFTMMISRYIFHGTMSSPLTAASLVTGFIIFFAGIHYGKILGK